MKKTNLLLLLFIFFGTEIMAYDAVLFDGTGKTSKEKLAAMSIAGIVNRDTAQLFLKNVYETWSYNMTDENWQAIYEEKGEVTFTVINTLGELIDHFRDHLNGAVTYESTRVYGNFSGQAFRWQAEYAALIGGLTNRIPLVEDDANTYNLDITDSVFVEDAFDDDAGRYVPCRIEDENHIWNNPDFSEEEAYLTLLRWGVDTLLPICNTSKFYIREITDFSIQNRMFQVNLAGTSSLDFYSLSDAKAEIIEDVLIYLHEKNPTEIFHIYGWIHPEPLAQWFACYGASFHETLMANLSWHSSFPVPERTYTPPAAVNSEELTVENKYYVTFIGTEGDACNWVVGLQSGAWLSENRGDVPVSWGWNLHIFDICPFIAGYYYDTGTENDGFISVTSPLGYAYPDLWGDDVWNGAVNETRRLMDKFGVKEMYGYKHYASSGAIVYRGKEIMNSYNFQRYGEFQAEVECPLTILFDPLLPSQYPVTRGGSLLFSHSGDGSFYGESSDIYALKYRILDILKSKEPPTFLLGGYQRLRQDNFYNRSDPSNADISIKMLNQAVGMLKDDPEIGDKIEVVTTEKFSALMQKHVPYWSVEQNQKQKNQLQQNYPNPFMHLTRISYSLKSSTHVKLCLYDVCGKQLQVLVNEMKPQGVHHYTLQGKNLSKGVYFYTLTTNGHTETKRLIKK